MARGAGTGQPIRFACSEERKEGWRVGTYDYAGKYGVPEDQRITRGDIHALHRRIVRTGRSRAKRDGRASGRTLDALHEYRCECGHVGWSRHIGVLNCPLDNA